MPKNKRLWLKLACALAGALGGFIYWNRTGIDPTISSIGSTWYYSALWGLVLGYFAGSIIAYFLWRRAAENE